MKKCFLTLCLLPLLLCNRASAEGTFSQPYGCCPSPFDGFYVGGHIGFASYHSEHVDLDGFFVFGGNGNLSEGNNFSRKDIGWAGGFQIGYGWVFCNKLLGLVWDWDWSNSETKLHSRLVDRIQVLTDFSINRRLHWFSTIRGRAGLAFNNTLLYLTAGGAFADFKTRLSGNFVLESRRERHTFKHHRWGWTAGLGAEFALWCQWSVNAEVLFMRFDTKRVRFAPTTTTLNGPQVDFDINDDVWVGRIGLNYRFSLCNW